MKKLNICSDSSTIFAIMLLIIVLVMAVPLRASDSGIETDIRSLQKTYDENKELIEKAEKSIPVMENVLEDKDTIFLQMSWDAQAFLNFPPVWLLPTDEAIAFLQTKYIFDSMREGRPYSRKELNAKVKSAFRRSEELKKEMQGILDDYENKLDRARKANVQIENQIAELKQRMLDTTAPASSARSLERITINEATYGWNCRKFKPWSGRANTVKKDNDTKIRSECEGRSTCKYTIDYKKIGDPAYGCEKEYEVTYKCMPSGKTFTKKVAKEAGWGDKAVTLSCP